MNTNVITIGIDTALQKIGLAVRRNDRFEPHLITPGRKARAESRLIYLRARVLDFVLPAKPDLIAIEGYSYGSQTRAFALGEIGGVLKTELVSRGFPIVVVPPAALKRFMTGSGQASKARMIAAVREHLKFPTDNDDIADAVALAHFAFVALTRQTTRRCELEAVFRLQNSKI